MAVRERALEVAAHAVKQHFNSDHSDYVGQQAPCSCGKGARYAGRRDKTFETVLGQLALGRAYYHCAACERGFCPRDRQLGLEGTSLSPGVTRMAGLVGSTMSFLEGDELLLELAGISLGAKMVERTAESLGQEIAVREKEDADPEMDRPVAPTMYMGIDGTGVPMRPSEVAGRAGKQEDGSARTREVKLCVVWTAEGRNEDGIPTRDPGSMTYSAAIESAASSDTHEYSSEFGQRAYREGCRRRFDQAPRRVVLGDGAAWIWNLADEQFPGAIQILDRFHAKQHLSDAAKEIWGSQTANYYHWLDRRESELDAGNITTLVERLQVHADHCDEANKCANYFVNHSNKMRYAEFHAAALCTSSGIVESSCKNVIGARLKRSGMHWSVRGADAIIALRCAKLSGRLDPFLDRRQASKPAA